MRHIYFRFIKPLLDILTSALVFILLFPIFITLVIVLFIFNRRQVFFTQVRPGLYGKPFTLLKFKTMADIFDKNGDLLPDNLRTTKIGTFLRKTSLDEIPQLLNVIFGQMSIVGPRPLLMEYLPLYSEHQLKRHDVKPGITGWAQVNGRNLISWNKKFELDVWYVQNIGFTLDVKIILATVFKVFRAEGVNTTANQTMEKFTGSN